MHGAHDKPKRDIIMSKNEELERHTAANLKVRSSILEAIKANLEEEKLANLSELGNLSGAIDKLAARNLYSKGPPDDNYSKNTQRQFNPGDLVQTPTDIQRVLRGSQDEKC